jgi:hypothetical protein
MKSRAFQSKFFVDPYIQTLGLKERYVYIYYLFNERVNWLGCYEISDRTVLFEIGDEITEKDLLSAKKKFSDDQKILFCNSYIILKNSEKYETHMTNKQLMGSAMKQFVGLPDNIKKVFVSYKPKEIIDEYNRWFDLLGLELDICSLQCNLQTGYSVDEGQRQGKGQVISNKDKENKKSNFPKLILEEEREIIKFFKVVYGIKTELPNNNEQIKAAKWLFKEKGLDMTCKSINAAFACRGLEYAPSINSLMELRDKYGKLEEFYKRKKENGKRGYKI